MLSCSAPSTLFVLLCLTSLACGPVVSLDDGANDGTSAAGDNATSWDTAGGEGPISTTAAATSTTAVPTGGSGNDSAGTTGGRGNDTADTADTADSDAESDDGFFIPPFPDLAVGCSGGGAALLECDLWSQDCPASEKCIAFDNNGSGVLNATRCVAVVRDPVGIGEACSIEGQGSCSAGNCDFGSFCYFVDAETSEGTCVAQCTGSATDPTCAEPTQCLVGQEGTFVLCLETCDPLAGACGEGQHCIPASDDAFWCLPDGQAEAGYLEGCTQLDQCAESMACLDSEFAGCAGDASCCTPYCDLALGDPNPACPNAVDGQTCAPWYAGDNAPVGFEDLGFCQAP